MHPLLTVNSHFLALTFEGLNLLILRPMRLLFKDIFSVIKITYSQDIFLGSKETANLLFKRIYSIYFKKLAHKSVGGSDF